MTRARKLAAPRRQTIAERAPASSPAQWPISALGGVGVGVGRWFAQQTQLQRQWQTQTQTQTQTQRPNASALPLRASQSCSLALSASVSAFAFASQVENCASARSLARSQRYATQTHCAQSDPFSSRARTHTIGRRAAGGNRSRERNLSLNKQTNFSQTKFERRDQTLPVCVCVCLHSNRSERTRNWPSL